MSENKVVYITPEAESKAKWIAHKEKIQANIKASDALINSAIQGFKKGDPIESILAEINSNYDNFNNWVYDKEAFQNEEYVWLFDASHIFMPDEDIFEYYGKEQLDLNTNEEILKFMHSTIDEKCFDAIAYHYEPYKGVGISTTAQCQGQGGIYYSGFDIFKSKDIFLNVYVSDIVCGSEGMETSDAELISMFKKHVTNKYF